jgi:hypothetical protein
MLLKKMFVLAYLQERMKESSNSKKAHERHNNKNRNRIAFDNVLIQKQSKSAVFAVKRTEI